jgi:hypothetical protein
MWPRFLLLLILLVPAAGLGQAPTNPCSEPEATQFDFWIGEWEVHAGGKIVGHNRISRIQGGCTLLEQYDTLPGKYEGKSFNYYDSSDALWHQVWVDNGGTRLHLKGGYADGKMVLSGARSVGEKVIVDRITWKALDDGTVSQVWDVSEDGGSVFKTIFDGLYRPKE